MKQTALRRHENAINGQYGRPDLDTALLRALRNNGKDLTRLSAADLAPFEEIHLRGREATRELASLAGLGEGTRVLDAGCGIGGPARTLAAEYGCQVIGLDLNRSFCRAGEMLTACVGLGERIAFRHGSVVDIPFDDARFDVVWLQHMAMNIEEKERLFQEAHRVLRPSGKLALYEVVAGTVGSPHFPVPWANEASISFLVSSAELQQAVIAGGFAQITWSNDSEQCIDWYRNVAAAGSPNPLAAAGYELLLGSDFREKARNARTNLVENRIAVIQALFQRVS